MRAELSLTMLLVSSATVVAGLSFLPQAQAQPPGARRGVTLERDPQAVSDAEKRVLDVLDDVDHRQRVMSVPREDGRLLRILAQSIGAKHVVELGTSTGYSGLWICLALRETGGKLTTYELDAERAETARENFRRAGVDDLVTIVVGDAHQEVAKIEFTIDLAFIDADKPGYVDYLEKLLPKVRPGGLIVAHNMRRPEPDPKFVEAITTNPQLDTVFLNMESAGVAVSLKKQ